VAVGRKGVMGGKRRETDTGVCNMKQEEGEKRSQGTMGKEKETRNRVCGIDGEKSLSFPFIQTS